MAAVKGENSVLNLLPTTPQTSERATSLIALVVLTRRELKSQTGKSTASVRSAEYFATMG